jgi:hypothetical protein
VALNNSRDPFMYQNAVGWLKSVLTAAEARRPAAIGNSSERWCLDAAIAMVVSAETLFQMASKAAEEHQLLHKSSPRTRERIVSGAR